MGIVLHWFLPTNGDSRTDLSLGNAVSIRRGDGQSRRSVVRLSAWLIVAVILPAAIGVSAPVARNKLDRLRRSLTSSCVRVFLVCLLILIRHVGGNSDVQSQCALHH